MFLNRKEKALIITICVNLLLIALKFVLASVSGSLALKAGAWHSFSDIFVSAIVLFGLFISRRENLTLSKGVSRIENYVSIIVSFFILYIGYDIFQEVVQGGERDLEHVPIVILGAMFTIATSYFMARYKLYVGKETNSPSLIADGYHSKMDMYSSVVSVIGLIGYLIGLVNMDKVAAVIIVTLIGWTALEIFMGAIRALRNQDLPDTAHRHLVFDFAGKYYKDAWKFGVPLLILIYLASGIYSVRWDQTGIVKRFGKPIETIVPPGVHYALPWPAGQVDLVDSSTIKTVEFRSDLMLTGDENLIEATTVVHYTVKNAFDFLYRIKEPEKLVEYSIESALRQVVSMTDVDSLLTTGKEAIQGDALKMAQEELDKEQSGIRLFSVLLPRITPPEDVMSAFRDVASAKEDKATYLNEAFAYQNEIVPVSRGMAAELVAEAVSYREQKINYANGESQNFLDRQREYQKAPDVTKTRMYIETMEKILPGVDKLIVDSKVETETTDLWFMKGKAAGEILKEVR